MQDYQKYFVDGTSPFSEAGSDTHEKCPSDEIERTINNGKPSSLTSPRNDLVYTLTETSSTPMPLGVLSAPKQTAVKSCNCLKEPTKPLTASAMDIPCV